MATIVLSWNENIEPDISTYKVYWGPSSGLYTAVGSPKTMGNVIQGTIDVIGDGDVFAAFTAVNTSSQESAFSTQISAKFLNAKGALRGT